MDRLLLLLAGIGLITLGITADGRPVTGESIPEGVHSDIFGRLPDGRSVIRYTLSNPQGIRMQVINYGLIVTSLEVPDANGKVADVVLGFDTLDEYVERNPYFGCVVGRYANRINNGRFTLEGRNVNLATNDGHHHLHGGLKGFDKALWDTRPVKSEGGIGVEGEYLSQDGEEGYPGNLRVKVRYILTDRQEFRIEYTATTDRTTVINLTHHSYFNLKGHEGGNILDHRLHIKASRYTPVGDGLIPTGRLESVRGTPLDFTRPKPIGRDIGQSHPQLLAGGGYDHNWVIDPGGGGVELVARVAEPASGRIMEVWSDQPGLQFYSGNFLDGSLTGKGGVTYRHRQGFCLEAQHFPDSPNHRQFPSTVLKPGATYQQVTIYRFGVR
jgi:aldose 1-epimerase